MAGTSELGLSPWWWLAVGYGVGARVLDGLLDRHREPHRHYHTATHVEWVLRHIDTLRSGSPLADTGSVLAAAFFHDAVYNPTAPTGVNERDSAALAERELGGLGWPSSRTRRVAELIEATCGHDADIDDADMMVLLDADLAVLGADTAAYDAYVRGVRAEYGHLDDASWKVGRERVLRSFLERPAVFATAVGRRQWESRARANLTAELAGLAAHNHGTRT
jgi:predicted metal-dependent HD superfamily phosphohydrolase